MIMIRAICFLVISSTATAFPPSLRDPLPISINQIVSTNVTCDERSFNASITLQHPFKGLLFAKDFSHECNAIGTMSEVLTISLPTSGCGIRLSTKRGQNQMVYSLVLVLQQDRHLRQIADQEKLLQCVINEEAFLIESQSLDTAIKRTKRISRMRKDDTQSLSLAPRAWMEITPEDYLSNTLKVGEVAVLTVKSTLPSGIGWKVIDCTAHDGLGDASQKLLDETGCPIDELLMPIPKMGPIQSFSEMQHQEATSRFAAFKFPDRDRLHFTCFLELCQGACPEFECGAKNDSNRSRRNLEMGEVLDRLKVFNSVEVIAPAIDDVRKSERLQSEPPIYPFSDRSFCVSPEKVAITFCILGIIFLCAVMVAACALIRSRKHINEGPFYSRSLFSSSSGGSAYGSKLLLQESPCMGQSNSRRMIYGRMM